MFHIIYFINDDAKILTFPQTAKRLCRNIGGTIADNHKKSCRKIAVPIFIRTFAGEMTIQELKRRISAWVLLATLIPLLLLSALHTHERVTQDIDNCTACVNHQPHEGHLTASTTTLTNCVLCQFLSLQYLETATTTLIVAVSFIVLTCCTNTVSCPTRPHILHASRAPPFCL